MQQHSISIVIRAFNEERWLEPLLKYLRSQSVRDVEIVLVDSGSIDETRAIARRHCDQVIDIETDSFSYGYALNVGIAKSHGDLVAIVSAHTLPMHDRWLEQLAAPFGSDDGTLALTYGKQRGNGVTKLAEHTDFARQFPDRSRRQQGRDWFCHNANAMIRRDLWTQHPFDEGLPGLEDIAWARHWMDRGREIQYVAEAGILHIHEESWPQIYQRFRREAVAARLIGLPSSHIRTLVEETGLTICDVGRAIVRRRPDQVRDALAYRYWKSRATIDGANAPRDATWTGVDVLEAAEYQALEIQAENRAQMVSRRLPQVRPNEVVIRVSFVGICQTDLEVLRSTLGYFKDGTAKLPLVPGHEYSGVIAKKGASVDGVQVGDPVVGECILSCGVCGDCLANRQTACTQRREVGVVNYHGACAEYLVLPARFVHRLPTDISLLSASSVEPLAVVLKAFRRLGLGPSRSAGRSRVLVIGAGAIGNLCSQAAAHFGHRVTVVDPLRERLEHLKAICEEVAPALPGNLKPFQYVIEATGVAAMAEAMLTRTATGTDVLLLGFPYGPSKWNAERLVAEDKRVVGSVGSDYDTFEAAIRLLPNLDLTAFNQKVVDLQDWAAAYRLHESKQYLKIKLNVAAVRANAPRLAHVLDRVPQMGTATW